MVAKAGICTAKKEDGTSCRAPAQSGSAFCVFHDPGAADLRQAARRSGGVNRNRPTAVLSPEVADPKLETVTDVAGLLADTICRVRKGELDPRIANAVGYLAGVMIRALEGSDIERRIAELEETLRVSRMRPAGFDPGNPPLPAALRMEDVP
jgi:hypothetical protein